MRSRALNREYNAVSVSTVTTEVGVVKSLRARAHERGRSRSPREVLILAKSRSFVLKPPTTIDLDIYNLDGRPTENLCDSDYSFRVVLYRKRTKVVDNYY